jgi:hypothetical protein
VSVVEGTTHASNALTIASAKKISELYCAGSNRSGWRLETGAVGFHVQAYEQPDAQLNP